MPERPPFDPILSKNRCEPSTCGGIKQIVKRLIALTLLLGSLALAASGVVGMFQGKIVQVKGKELAPEILFVQGRNGMVRKVNISQAKVEYDDDFPSADRLKRPADSLRQNTVVRITAEQTEAQDALWKASEVLIISVKKKTPKDGPVTSASAAKPN